jgi:O-antigen/teichoic acid export membrane protein
LLLLVAVNASTTALCVLFVIIGHWPVTGAVAAMAVGSAVSFPFAVWLSRHQFHLRLRYEPALWATLLRQALPLGVNAVLVNLSLRIGPLLLLRLHGPEEVAFFSAASKLVEAFVLLPEVPMLTIFPIMAATRREGEGRLPAVTRTATRWTVTLLLPLILVVGGMAKPLLHLLYGEAFRSADDTLRVLVWITAFAATGAVWIGVLTTLGLQQLLVRFYALGTLVNVVLCWVLIPVFGSIGAAWAALLAAVVPQALLLWLPATQRYIRPAFLGVLPVLVLAIILTVLIALLPLAPVTATALGLVGYAVACVLTGVIGPQEWRLARQIIQRPAR